jgi:hypothetical protein
LALAAGCADPAAGRDEPGIAVRDEPIVYGSDDRVELYQVSDPKLRDIGHDALAALIKLEQVSRLSTNDVQIAGASLEETYGLCSGQRFLDELAAATCSGVLIDDDLLITAGHCIDDAAECKTYAFVFDYAYRAAGELEPLSGSDVYGCRKLVARKYTESGADYAIVQLDRPPVGREPVPVRTRAVVDGMHLVAMGMTSGLPLKIDRGSIVRQARATQHDYFALDSDTFEGSSGSAILDDDYALAGVLVRGGDDYDDTDAGCKVASVFPADAGTPDWGWEQATYVGPAVHALCAAKYPSRRLCDIAPRCGDGVCSFDPADADCPKDCEDDCDRGLCDKSAQNAVSAGAPVKRRHAQSCAVAAVSGAAAGLAPWALLLSACALLGRRSRRVARGPLSRAP